MQAKIITNPMPIGQEAQQKILLFEYYEQHKELVANVNTTYCSLMSALVSHLEQQYVSDSTDPKSVLYGVNQQLQAFTQLKSTAQDHDAITASTVKRKDPKQEAERQEALQQKKQLLETYNNQKSSIIDLTRDLVHEEFPYVFNLTSCDQPPTTLSIDHTKIAAILSRLSQKYNVTEAYNNFFMTFYSAFLQEKQTTSQGIQNIIKIFKTFFIIKRETHTFSLDFRTPYTHFSERLFINEGIVILLARLEQQLNTLRESIFTLITNQQKPTITAAPQSKQSAQQQSPTSEAYIETTIDTKKQTQEYSMTQIIIGGASAIGILCLVCYYFLIKKAP